jgi:hypothetical protein
MEMILLDYEGSDTDFEQAREFFKRKFLRMNRSTSKEIYCRFTTALDTKLLKTVMISVTE